MKIIRIFGVVLALHVVGGILFIQPGCQSQPRPQTEETAPATGEPTERLDWDEWEEADEEHVSTERPRSAPRRPATPPPSETTEVERLEPLPGALEPVRSTSETRDTEPAGTYTVRGGDSLWMIANRNNVSLRALLSENNLTEDSVIQPGQELRLPAGSSGGTAARSTASSSSSRPSGTTTYTVRSGDSLSVIARRHNTTVQDLKALNDMSSDVIRIDQRLVVPEGGSAQPAARASSSSSSGSSSGNGQRHTVQSGETPGAIAARYGVSASDLMSANNISDPRRMRIGQELVIPGSDASSSDSGSTPSSSEREETRRSEPEPEEREEPEPAPEAPTPRDIPVLEPDDDEEEDFPILPVVPGN